MVLLARKRKPQADKLMLMQSLPKLAISYTRESEEYWVWVSDEGESRAWLLKCRLPTHEGCCVVGAHHAGWTPSVKPSPSMHHRWRVG